MAALLPFTKYHGLGNDFILIDARDLILDAALSGLLSSWPDSVKRLAPFLCDRNRGVGGDGVILAIQPPGEFERNCSSLESGEESHRRRHDGGAEGQRAGARRSEPSKECSSSYVRAYKEAVSSLLANYPGVGIESESYDAAWIYTNSDGSESVMCGNGLRCLVLWCHEKLAPKKSTLSLATARGLVAARVFDDDHEVERLITVDVGEPILDAERIPVAPGDTQLVRLPLDIEGRKLQATSVGMGNPHCVIFDDRDGLKGVFKFNDQGLARIAKDIQRNSIYPEGANIEFVVSNSRDAARCIVYERGCGFTLACASGAAAVLVAGVLEDRLDRKASIHLPGGLLQVEWSEKDNKVRITGPAVEVFTGVMRLPDSTEDQGSSHSHIESTMEANC